MAVDINSTVAKEALFARKSLFFSGFSLSRPNCLSFRNKKRLIPYTFSAETLHILGRKSTKPRPEFFAIEGKWETIALYVLGTICCFYPFHLFVLCSKSLCFPSLKKSLFLGWHGPPILCSYYSNTLVIKGAWYQKSCANARSRVTAEDCVNPKTNFF